MTLTKSPFLHIASSEPFATGLPLCESGVFFMENLRKCNFCNKNLPSDVFKSKTGHQCADCARNYRNALKRTYRTTPIPESSSLNGEIWKDIVNYEGLYQISNYGRVKSIPRGRRLYVVILTILTDKYGYTKVALTRDRKSTQFTIHRLLSTAFIPNPENKPCVNHINGIKNDNRIENLEWCTYSENILHAFRVLKRRSPNGGRGKIGALSKNSKPILQMDKDGNPIRSFAGASEAQRLTGMLSTFISSCANKKCKTAYGYKWEYIK